MNINGVQKFKVRKLFTITGLLFILKLLFRKQFSAYISVGKKIAKIRFFKKLNRKKISVGKNK